MFLRNYSSVDTFILLGLTSNPHSQLVLFPIFFLIYIITFVGNSLIILGTLIGNNLQTPMYFFLTNLSFMDICYSSTVVPRMLKDLVSQEKSILFGECFAQMYIGLSLAYCECILLPVMAYDRYVAVCYPLHYTAIMNRSVCIKLATGTWICGFLFSICIVTFIFSLPMCDNNKINHFLCEPQEVLLLACMDLSVAQNGISVIVAIVAMIPIIFILVSYIKIIVTILKIPSAIGRRKTFSTCASHMIVVNLFYVLAMVTYIKPASSYSSEQDKVFAIAYTVLTPMLNPLIYTLRNKEFKTALKDITTRRMYCL